MARARIEATVGLRTGRFRRGMARIRRSMARFKASVIAPIARLGKVLFALGIAGTAAAVAGITALIHRTAKFGDTIGKAAKRTGISVEELQRYKHAAELSGTSLEAVEKGIKRMASFLDDVNNELLEAERSFDALGLSIKDFQGLSAEEAFGRILEALADIPDALQRSAMAQDVFGRAGTQLLPMLDQGAEGLRAMKEEADRLGIIMSPEQIVEAERFQDEVLRVKGTLAGLGRAIAVRWLPAINAALETFRNKMIEFAESGAFERMADSIKEGAALLLAAGAAISKAPSKFGLIFDLIVAAMKAGAALMKAAIMTAIADSPLGKFLKKEETFGFKTIGKLVGDDPQLVSNIIGMVQKRTPKEQLEGTLAGIKEEVKDLLKDAAGGPEKWAEIVEKIRGMFAFTGVPKPAGRRPDKMDAADTRQQFTNLRRIGGDILMGAAAGPRNLEQKKVSLLEQIQKRIAKSNELLRERITGGGGAVF